MKYEKGQTDILVGAKQTCYMPHVRSAKTQFSLHTAAISPETLLSTSRSSGSMPTDTANSEDYDATI